MREDLQKAIDAITKQQPKARNAVWMVGEQLKDILRESPDLAPLVLEDLAANKKALADCEKEIKAFADAHKTGSFACVIPSEADEIIRKHFGLPLRGDAPKAEVEPEPEQEAAPEERAPASRVPSRGMEAAAEDDFAALWG